MKVFVVWGLVGESNMPCMTSEVLGVFKDIQDAIICLDKKFIEIAKENQGDENVTVDKRTLMFSFETNLYEYHYEIEEKELEE